MKLLTALPSIEQIGTVVRVKAADAGKYVQIETETVNNDLQTGYQMASMGVTCLDYTNVPDGLVFRGYFSADPDWMTTWVTFEQLVVGNYFYPLNILPNGPDPFPVLELIDKGTAQPPDPPDGVWLGTSYTPADKDMWKGPNGLEVYYDAATDTWITISGSAVLLAVGYVDDGDFIPTPDDVLVSYLLNFVIAPTQMPEVTINTDPHKLATIQYIQDMLPGLVTEKVLELTQDTIIIVSPTQPAPIPAKNVLWVRK
jgi:hypothetical protein